MEIVVMEGQQLQVEPIIFDPIEKTFGNLQPGDTVIGRRGHLDREWLMGTVSERLWETTKKTGWMYCDEIKWYPFNIGECRKVIGFN